MQVVTKDEIARRLRQGREESGMRQADIAEKLGLTQGLISQWEKGNVPEGACEVASYGLLVGVRPDELFLSDVSSTVRTLPSGMKLAPAEEDALGVVVDSLLRMRTRGIPISDTAKFLTSVLREPAVENEKSDQPPPTLEVIDKARALVDGVMSNLPQESVDFARLDTAAKQLRTLSDSLRSECPPDRRKDSSATASKAGPSHAPRPSGRKKSRS